MLPAPSPVRFGSFELDLQSGELRREGLKIRLADQPLQVLTLLLENPGEIVTREQLQKRLWSSDTFVDFEHSLNAAVKRVREALGDSAENPRFIETLPRHGYRFIVPTHNLCPTYDQRDKRSWWATKTRYYFIVGLALFLATAATAWYLQRQPLASGDQVLLGAFQNSTADVALGETLRQGLTAKLIESPYLNVVPEERVRATLASMKRTPNEPLSPDIAREVCERQGVKAMINGRINQIGSHYIISLEANNCRTGERLAFLQAETETKENSIRVLGQLASKLRLKLGESLRSIAKYDIPLEEATTDSLEALTYYSLGRMQQRTGDYTSAIALYQQAVTLDPNFATAWSVLGQRLRWQANSKAADDALTRAFNLRDRVSAREKNNIAANYYYQITGEMEKAEAACLSNVTLYPTDVTCHVFLSNIYGDFGRLEDAIAQLKQAQKIFPEYLMIKFLLAMNLKGLNRFDEAATFAKGEVEKAYPELALELAFIREDQDTVRRWIDEERGGPHDLSGAEIAANQYRGRLRRSRSQIPAAVHSIEAKGGTSAELFALQALIDAEVGNPATARALLSTVDGSSVIIALAKARSGKITESSAMLQDLSRRYPQDTFFQILWKPAVLGAIELQAGHPELALAALQNGTSYELGFGGPQKPDAFVRMYLRGCARLRLGQTVDAIADFQRVLDHRGLEPLSPYYPLSNLGLARAYAASGDTNQGLKAYEAFFAIWNAADDDIPLYQQARIEYQELKDQT